MKRTLAVDTVKCIGKEVKICGWVNSRRDHGKLIFIDLRDRTGLLQLIVGPKNKNLYKMADSLRPEWVIEIEGVVNERPEKMINPNLSTGKVELKVKRLEILNKAKTPPFEIIGNQKIGEEVRLKYRYLDLRRERMKDNIIFRHKVIKLIRDYLDKNGFLEIETPILTKSTPEGARDFLVPSRMHQGEFYALPQAPQQLKQLLMFTNQKEIMNLIEELMIEIVELTGKSTQDRALIARKLTFKPFKVLTYDEAIKKYKTDKPDLRKNKKNPNEICFVWIVDWPLFEWDKNDKRWDPMHHIFTAPKEEDINLLDKYPSKVHSWQHDLVCNGQEVAGGSIRNHKAEIQHKMFKLVGLKEKEIKEKFNHLLKAFEYGAPPHGGIALGVERLLMILKNESSVREVMAFPKNGDGRDLMMEAPSKVDAKQLRELGIKFKK